MYYNLSSLKLNNITTNNFTEYVYVYTSLVTNIKHISLLHTMHFSHLIHVRVYAYTVLCCFCRSITSYSINICRIICWDYVKLQKFRRILENFGISRKSGNFWKIREFRKIPEKISGISGKTFFGNFRNCKKFGQLFGKSRCFYKNRSAQQCTHSKN